MFYNVFVLKSKVQGGDHDMQKPVDVICQHCADGSIIPIKIRVQDDEQVYNVYNIKSYTAITSDKIMLPSEVMITTDLMRYDCKIEVFGIQKRIVLHYSKSRVQWYVYF